MLETRLNHLVKRRDFLGTRVQNLQAEMNTLERRLELLLASREQIEEHRRLESLRHDLANVEDRICRAEERRQLRDRDNALYREIEQLKATLGPSAIIRDASVLLQRMTGGAFRRIRINESHEVWIDDADSKTVSLRRTQPRYAGPDLFEPQFSACGRLPSTWRGAACTTE